MTDHDNLRNRIAAKILDNFNPPDDKHPSWWINPEVSAQAIIDELGLTVETMTLGGMREDGAPFTSTLIVGKWEKQ